jgi:hypothetical protein
MPGLFLSMDKWMKMFSGLAGYPRPDTQTISGTGPLPGRCPDAGKALGKKKLENEDRDLLGYIFIGV